ncbi:MAG: ParA family protein [Betaproteobacteria bacterium]
MHTIIVANPKGGTGKTTLATNIAGWLAGKKQRVVLADFDTQRSSTQWLARRSELLPKIFGWTPEQDKQVLVDAEPQWLVIDLPAGVHGETLRDAVRRAEIILIPVSPSAFDMDATRTFLAKMAEYKSVKAGNVHIGLVGMRVDSRTRSAIELEEFLKQHDFPFVTNLRDTQVYVHAARDGLSVFDMPRSRVEQDWDQWRVLTRWIGRQTAK